MSEHSDRPDDADAHNDPTDPPRSTAGAADVPGDFPLRRFLGMDLLGDGPGTGIATVELGPEHLNPNGVAHGAVLFALVDTAMGKATMSVVDEGRWCASVEVSLRFIRPATNGRLEARASVVKRGRAIVHLDGRVTGGDGRLIATAAGTFAVLGG